MSVFIEKITIKNLLSFDEEGIVDFELKPLNVLIGANASGKSNFVAALRILTACAGDFQKEIRSCGGITEVINKNERQPRVILGSEIRLPSSNESISFYTYFAQENSEVTIFIGEMFNLPPRRILNDSIEDIRFQLEYPGGFSWDEQRGYPPSGGGFDKLAFVKEGHVEDIPDIYRDRQRSILSNPIHPSMIAVRDMFYTVHDQAFYPVFGPVALQTPNEAGVAQDRLLYDGSNLASYIARLNESTIVDREILPKIKELYQNVSGIGTSLKGGRVYITLKEEGLKQAIRQPRICLMDC